MTITILDQAVRERLYVREDFAHLGELLGQIADKELGDHDVVLSRRAGFHYIDCGCGFGTDGDIFLSSAFTALFVEHLEPLIEGAA